MNKTVEPRQFFDQIAPRRERDMRRHASFYRDRIAWLRRIIPASASVIDVGCGIGGVLGALPQTKKTGIDFSSAMIELARAAHPSAHFVTDDVETLTHHETYDYVLLLDTVNYLRDCQRSLRNIREHLCTQETRLIMTFFNFLWSPIFRLAEFLGLRTKFPAQSWLS